MAIYINNIIPFDAENSFTFLFSYTGGNQAKKNKLIIKDNFTTQTVYENTIETMQLRHTVPSGILTNGKTYIGLIYIYDIDNNLCGISPLKIFKCLATPTFRFTNIEENQIIRNSSYNLNLTYSQVNGDKLQSYEVFLCDINRNILSSSSTIYNTDNLGYMISSLTDDMQYCVFAKGVTVSGIEIITNYVIFSVNYLIPQQWYLVDLANKPDIGAIQITSNIISIIGKSDSEPVYIAGDFIDLRKQDSFVVFDEGFELPEGGTIIIPFMGCSIKTQNKKLATLQGIIQIFCRFGEFESYGDKTVCYFEMQIPSSISGLYIQRTECIDVPSEEDLLCLCIIRQNNLYGMKLVNLTKEGLV